MNAWPTLEHKELEDMSTAREIVTVSLLKKKMLYSVTSHNSIEPHRNRTVTCQNGWFPEGASEQALISLDFFVPVHEAVSQSYSVPWGCKNVSDALGCCLA